MPHETRVSKIVPKPTSAAAHNSKSAGTSRSIIPPIQKAPADKQNENAFFFQPKTTHLKPVQLKYETDRNKHPQHEVLQLKESDQLNPAGFNMIGETHTLYPDTNSRMYDAKNIKQAIGQDTAYYTEDTLKLNKDDNDYADRIDLTLEYIITFMKEKIGRINELIPHFNDIQLVVDQEEAVENNLDLSTEDEVTDPVENLEDAKLAAADVAPKLVGDIEVDTVIAYIRQKDYRLEVLELLATVGTWEKIPAFDDGTIFDNAMSVIAEIETLISEKIEAEDSSNHDNDEAPVNDNANTNEQLDVNINPEPDQDVEQYGNLQNSIAELVVLIKSLYKESHMLFKKKLMLYVDLMEKTNGAVSPDGFKFDVSKIPDVLALWNKVEDIYRDAESFLISPALFLPPIILGARTTFPALTETINEAILNEGKNREREPLRKFRSQQMNKAAELLKDQKIAWKVGDKHIDDIREIEKDQGAETGYTYISVENFSKRYYNPGEIKDFKGSKEELVPEYIEAKTQTGNIVKEKLKTYK